jgi:hypothetical protein
MRYAEQWKENASERGREAATWPTNEWTMAIVWILLLSRLIFGVGFKG